MRIRRFALAILLLSCLALFVTDHMGYTKIGRLNINLRFWERQSKEDVDLPGGDLQHLNDSGGPISLQEGGAAPEEGEGQPLPQGGIRPPEQGGSQPLASGPASDSILDPAGSTRGTPRVSADSTESQVVPDDSTGNVDSGMANQPFPSGMCSCEYEDRVIRLSNPPMSGDDVLQLQKALITLGYFQGTLTGVYTGSTADAVKRFQADSGLAVDGVFGRKTADALGMRLYKEDESTWYLSIAEHVSTPSSSSSAVGDVIVVVDLNARRLTVYSDGIPIKSYPAAVGASSTPSPIGDWKVIDKGLWGGGFGTRWIGLNVPWGRYGIHGTNQPGTIGAAASHGCIRMFNRDVEDLYKYVKWGTPVKITAGGYGNMGYHRPNLLPGSRNNIVREVQYQLRDFGYLKGNPDGIYGHWTEQAIRQFQADHGLKVSGIVDSATYDALGMYLCD